MFDGQNALNFAVFSGRDDSRVSTKGATFADISFGDLERPVSHGRSDAALSTMLADTAAWMLWGRPVSHGRRLWLSTHCADTPQQ